VSSSKLLTVSARKVSTIPSSVAARSPSIMLTRDATPVTIRTRIAAAPAIMPRDQRAEVELDIISVGFSWGCDY
jgi:hypothetical protein